ncbi:hypothetical protein SAMN05421855_1078 [Ulvibacter litoralis]|uniref:Uncharacterized protein n=2 Tax=Ulvibacter litoralis TaxID=227084 RepID=A0A1G7IUE0_9FLAO|nr:hypothetical protein GCM10008083_30560 [Ulvibacter litoralis]SDF15919.1 hypothetical protein SAMN05421855_1078 [Ulvibacter litoralis]
MENRKILDALPDDLTTTYFSDSFFYKKGAMSTWIWNIAAENAIDELKIDILNKKVLPEEVEIEAVLAYLPRLKNIIDATLEKEKLPSECIQEAVFHIKVFQEDPHLKCTAILTDNTGRKHIGNKFSYNVYEAHFKHFNLKSDTDMDWASEGENQLNTSEWFGALLRYFASFGKKSFNSFYNQRELKKNAIIGNLFQIVLVVLFFYFLYQYSQS